MGITEQFKIVDHLDSDCKMVHNHIFFLSLSGKERVWQCKKIDMAEDQGKVVQSCSLLGFSQQHFSHTIDVILGWQKQVVHMFGHKAKFLKLWLGLSSVKCHRNV